MVSAELGNNSLWVHTVSNLIHITVIWAIVNGQMLTGV